MSLILKGIDRPKMGEVRRIVIYDNGDVVVNEEGWDEDGCKYYKTSYDVEAIQIPKDHGRLIDAELLKDTIRDSVPAYTIGVKIPTFGDTQIMSAIDVMPTILEKERE